MSVEMCHYCDRLIDLDENLEHFNESGMCMREEEVIVLRLSKLAEDISNGNVQLDPERYEQQISKELQL